MKRATFIPALKSFSSMSTDRDDGPKVHTIFVFGLPWAATPSIFSIALLYYYFHVTETAKTQRERERERRDWLRVETMKPLDLLGFYRVLKVLFLFLFSRKFNPFQLALGIPSSVVFYFS